MKRLFTGSAALVIFLCSSALLAVPGILKTKSGQTYNGDIKDDGDSYSVTVDKIETPIPKADVVSVSYTGSMDDQFNQRIAKLSPKDSEGRVKVARFAFDSGRNDLAIQALSGAMEINPDNADAMEMLRTVQAQQQLDHSRAVAAAALVAPPAADQTSGTTGSPPISPLVAAIPKHLLTPADINSIRQYEMNTDENIPISIPADLRRKFSARAGMNYNDFSALSPYDQLQLILQKGDPEMRAAAKVGRDPETILEFKREIQPMVLRNCATSGCHGGAAGGKFILFDGNDSATTYTNFYIMEQFAMKTAANAGFFGGGGGRKLLERGDGAHSLLVNFSLPDGVGDVSHPKIPNSSFNGIFRSREDRLYQQAILWMNKRLNLIEPDYGIHYTPPTAATQPTTLP